MTTTEVDEIWFVDKLRPYETGSNFEKSIGRHISVVAVDPEWHDNNGDEVKVETE